MYRVVQRFGRLTVAATVVVVALGTSWTVGRILSDPAHDSYPDAPFDPFDPAAPRPWLDYERPADQQGAAAYDAKSKELYDYFNQQGAFSRATPEEQAALSAVQSAKYVQGRESAERILRVDPTSVVALITLARAEADGEADWSRALSIIRRARHLLEQRGRANPHDADAREWYLRTLSLEYEILAELAQHGPALLRSNGWNNFACRGRFRNSGIC